MVDMIIVVDQPVEDILMAAVALRMVGGNGRRLWDDQGVLTQAVSSPNF
jgi:hypothetical protein